MSRLRLPEFVRDVVGEPRQRAVLMASCLTLFAVGMLPRALSPGLATVQERLREDPQLQDVLLLLAFLGAAAVIAGGALADIVRHRGLVIGALGVMVAASLLGVVLHSGPLYYGANMLAVVAGGLALTFAIGSVATVYEGVPRATALGVAYGALGLGSAISPALFTLLVVRLPSTDPAVPGGFRYEPWPAYLCAALASALALWACRRWLPRLAGRLPAPVPLVTGLAVWSVGILAIAVGLLGLATGRGVAGRSGLAGGSDLLALALVVLGALALSTSLRRAARTRAQVSQLAIDRRGLGAALAVGVVVGFAQVVPLALLPPVFEHAMRLGHLFATVAIAPFAVALLAAGPVAGALLRRYRPRTVMAAGTLGLGLADLLLAALLVVLEGDPGYLAFIVPLAVIGAGFVLSTTVRTAIVFASTPRGLASSAAGLNEASVSLGSRIGMTAGAVVVTSTALAAAQRLVAGRPDAAALVDEFRSALVSLGTPRFREVLDAALERAGPLADVKAAAYGDAYLEGVAAGLVAAGVVGVGGAVLAWLLVGRRDPLRTVFDMQDERMVGGDLPVPPVDPGQRTRS